MRIESSRYLNSASLVGDSFFALKDPSDNNPYIHRARKHALILLIKDWSHFLFTVDPEIKYGIEICQ